MEQKDRVIFYPNPTKGNLLIELPNINEANVLIYTLAGKLIHVQKINQMNHTLNLHELHKGIYLMEIINEKYVAAEKLVIK
ncbi:T9SS type A sorting domain-containing protein [Bacteroidota bacterium]